MFTARSPTRSRSVLILTAGPQVGCHGLVQRQQSEAAFVDLDVQRVYRLVAAQHVVDGREVTRHEPLNGGAHALLRQPAHFEQAALKGLELLPEVRYSSLH
jgi:hypothetical protein